MNQIDPDIIDHTKQEAHKNSFYISILYVGLGLMALIGSSTTAMENDTMAIIIMLLFIATLPVTFISFGIMYGGAPLLWLWVIGVQTIVFFIFWRIVEKNMYPWILRKYIKESKEE